MGEDGRHQQEHRRVVEKPILYAGRGGVLFGGIVHRLIVYEVRYRRVRHRSGRIKTDEIGAGRTESGTIINVPAINNRNTAISIASAIRQ